MYMTKREQALTKAKEQGERDFEQHGDMPQYNDIGLEQAWRQGWKIAQLDYNSFYSNYN